MKSNWHIPPADTRSKQRDSQAIKFFASDAGVDSADDLGREGVQNSQDVRQDRTQPVCIRITFGTLSAESATPYRQGLMPHLDAVRTEVPHVATVSGECRFLSFEDFNTSGLTGDPAQSRRYLQDAKNAFHTFFRAEGKTDKQEGQRGSHGVGKVVFQAVSAARAVLGLTTRITDGRTLLFGTAVLPSHRLNGKDYDCDAWFGLDIDGHIMPEEDPAAVEQFRRDFSLTRRPDEAGLSLVVPWLDTDEVTPDRMIDAMLRGFSYPILQGDLVVEIVPTPGEAPVVIDAGSFLNLLSTRPDEQLEAKVRPTAELIQWLLQNPPTRTLNGPGTTASKWDEPGLLGDELAAAVRKELDDGQCVALRVPVRVPARIRPTAAKATASHFIVAFRREEAAGSRRATVQFMRHGLLIAGVTKAVPGYRAVVVAEEDGIADFLRAAENPSHTKWDHKPLRDVYAIGYKTTLEFVTDSIGRLVRLLTPPEGFDLDALADVFNVEDTRRTARRPGKKRKRGMTPPQLTQLPTKPPGPIPIKPKWWNVAQRVGGFAIRPTQAAQEATWPKRLRVAVAYDLPDGGSPLTAWSPFDFTLDNGKGNPIRLSGRQVKAVPGSKKNVLRLTVEGPEFELRVGGFETERGDLVIETHDTTADASADAEDAFALDDGGAA